MAHFSHMDHLVAHNGEIRINCPFCLSRGKLTPDTEKKCYINDVLEVYNCMRCGSRGSYLTVLKATHSDLEVFEYTIDLVSDPKKRLLKLRKTVETGRDLFHKDGLGTDISVLDIPARKYLASRGLTSEDIKTYGLLSGTGKYSRRIVIPTYDDYGNLVYFSARTYAGSTLRYLNAADSHKTLSVFNLNRAQEGDTIVVCEGAMSAISCEKKVLRSFLTDPEQYSPVAIYGKVISAAQAKLIAAKKPRQVVLMPDDGVTRAEIENQRMEIRRRFSGKISIAQIPVGQDDPDECEEHLLIKTLVQGMRYSIRL